MWCRPEPSAGCIFKASISKKPRKHPAGREWSLRGRVHGQHPDLIDDQESGAWMPLGNQPNAPQGWVSSTHTNSLDKRSFSQPRPSQGLSLANAALLPLWRSHFTPRKRANCSHEVLSLTFCGQRGEPRGMCQGEWKEAGVGAGCGGRGWGWGGGVLFHGTKRLTL